MCVPDQVCFSVCVCVKPLAESSYLRVISQSPEFDTMRSAELRRRHTLLFQATHVHSYTHTGIRWKHGRERDSGAPPHGRRQVFWPSLVGSIAQKLTEPQPLLLTTMCILLNPGDSSTVSSHFPQRSQVTWTDCLSNPVFLQIQNGHWRGRENSFAARSHLNVCELQYMLVHDMFALVSLSVTQKDVWILFASLTKWDTRNSCSGLTSRTRSAVKDHVSASLAFKS